MNQFPQPTRPFNSHNLIPVQMPQDSIALNEGNSLCSTQDRFQHHIFDPCIPQSTATATKEEEKQAIEDLLETITEWYEKLPESLKNTTNMDEMNASTRCVKEGLQGIAHNFERFKVKAVNMNSSRGLNGVEEESALRLERFKIRTVNLGGVVKGEEKP